MTEQTPLLRSLPMVESLALTHAGNETHPRIVSSSHRGGSKTSSERGIPQTIAHRGFKAAYPENTIPAFAAAIEVGANAIETDLHLTKDGVVVLSHDPTLRRCFGLRDKIIDCEWSYLSKLKTIQEPRSHMPRLLDLLLWLDEGGEETEDVWVLLDIKVPWPRLLEPAYQLSANVRQKLDNDAEFLMMKIAETVKEVEEIQRSRHLSQQNRSVAKPWRERLVLGCWAASYLPLCYHHLPGYRITHIGFSLSYAREFLKVPNVSFNLLQSILVGPSGSKFLAQCKAEGRDVYVWTVNKEEWMKWAIAKEVAGVITDDPEKFRRVAKEWDEGATKRNVSAREWGRLVWWNIVVMIFSFLFRIRYGFQVDTKRIEVEVKKSRGEVEDVVIKTSA